jgi:hypothetical protein
MSTSIRQGRDAQSLWFLDPLHTIHTTGFSDGEAFLVADGTLELRDGDEVVRLVRGEVVFGPCAGGDEARIVPLTPLAP